jgi:hypothetical protein
MNHPMNDSSNESAIWLDLVGANQGWLKRCRAAASGNPTALAELTDDNSPAARALQAGVTRTAAAPTEDPLAPLVSYDWQVALAIRSLTLALAGQLDPRGSRRDSPPCGPSEPCRWCGYSTNARPSC